jgi:peroxiredoxin Q/BCP
MRLLLAALGVIAIVVIAATILWPRVARADLLKEGDVAPPFATQMVVGEQVLAVSLVELRGKKVVLYFYPKNDTPGCTKEACAFRDDYARFQDAGIVVLGASVDGIDSHKAFIKKYNLPFGLLVDENKTIAKAYGAANGIPILGLNRRITYVIGEDGLIAKVYPDVDPTTHATQILADVARLDAARAQPAPAD